MPLFFITKFCACGLLQILQTGIKAWDENLRNPTKGYEVYGVVVLVDVVLQAQHNLNLRVNEYVNKQFSQVTKK